MVREKAISFACLPFFEISSIGGKVRLRVREKEKEREIVWYGACYYNIAIVVEQINYGTLCFRRSVYKKKSNQICLSTKNVAKSLITLNPYALLSP